MKAQDVMIHEPLYEVEHSTADGMVAACRIRR
jgi:hypothetical protein